MKRLLALLVALLLTLPMIPAVWADGETFYVGGGPDRPSNVPEGATWAATFEALKTNLTSATGAITIEVVGDGAGKLKIDDPAFTSLTVNGNKNTIGAVKLFDPENTEEKTVTFQNVTVENDLDASMEPSAIDVSLSCCEISFQGDCTIKGDSWYEIYLNGDDSSIAVEGTLKIEEVSGVLSPSGIYVARSNQTITIEENGKLEIESSGKGIELHGGAHGCTVNVNGSLTINAGSDGIGAAGSSAGPASIALNLDAGSSLKITAGTGSKAISVEKNNQSSSLTFNGLPADLSLTGGIAGIPAENIHDNTGNSAFAAWVEKLKDNPTSIEVWDASMATPDDHTPPYIL